MSPTENVAPVTGADDSSWAGTTGSTTSGSATTGSAATGSATTGSASTGAGSATLSTGDDRSYSGTSNSLISEVESPALSFFDFLFFFLGAKARIGMDII